MNKITLKNDGSLSDKGKIVQTDPLMYLNYGVELEDGYLLRSFFRMLANNTLLIRLNAFLPDCMQQYHACPQNQCVSAEIEYLELTKTVEMVGFPGEPRLEIYHSLYGIRGEETCEVKSQRLESLLDLPLKLGALKHVIFGDKVDVFKFETVFNLFEFIDGIVWELSFHGTPKACAL
jgi:hypothetical protein